MNKMIKAGIPAILAIASLAVPFSAVQAAEIDFSCMQYKVWGKSHVSDRYRDFDVVLESGCPGPASWAMCIERVDPWTNKVVETHNPTGVIQPEKKSRVNLHLKRGPDKDVFRNRFQSFYVSLGYSVKGLATAQCYARQCEEKKRGLRAKVTENEKAWEKTANRINALITAECPDSAWDESTQEECEREIREARMVEVDLFLENDLMLREQLATVDPEHCQIWSGELTDP
jgi:hypothetical protein